MYLASLKFFTKQSNHALGIPISATPSLLSIMTKFSDRRNVLSQGNLFALSLRSDQIMLQVSPYHLCHGRYYSITVSVAAQGLWAQLRRPVFAHSRLPQTSDEEMIQTKFVAEGAMGTMKWINSNDGSECTKIKHFIYRIRLEWANYQIQMLIRWRSRHWRKEGLKVGSLMDMLNEVTSMRKWSDIISGQKSMKITEL